MYQRCKYADCMVEKYGGLAEYLAPPFDKNKNYEYEYMQINVNQICNDYNSNKISEEEFRQQLEQCIDYLSSFSVKELKALQKQI